MTFGNYCRFWIFVFIAGLCFFGGIKGVLVVSGGLFGFLIGVMAEGFKRDEKEGK